MSVAIGLEPETEYYSRYKENFFVILWDVYSSYDGLIKTYCYTNSVWQYSIFFDVNARKNIEQYRKEWS